MKRIIPTIAAALAVCLTATAQNQQVMNSKKTLVAYFSATGTTERVAKLIAEVTGGDLYEITPVQEYTATDLDWTDKTSRSTKEMNDSKSRPAIKADLQNAGSYDVIYIGYPIWWNLAPRAVNTFLETYDFSGKTVIPFATSGGSGITNSAAQLRKEYPALDWQSGKLLNGASRTAIEAWVRYFQFFFESLSFIEAMNAELMIPVGMASMAIPTKLMKAQRIRPMGVTG